MHDTRPAIIEIALCGYELKIAKKSGEEICGRCRGVNIKNINLSSPSIVHYTIETQDGLVTIDFADILAVWKKTDKGLESISLDSSGAKIVTKIRN